jgi:uncharacterized protein (TIGR02145 family)
MKKRIDAIILLAALAIFSGLELNAQNWLINFTGSGASTSVTTVKVENLTSGSTLTLNGTDILQLTIVTGVNPVGYDQSSELKIYPNPMNEYSIFEVFPPVAGDAVISVCETTGKTVAQIKSYLENLSQSFKLSGLKPGIYLVNIKGNGYRLSGKLVSNGKSGGTINLEKVNSISQAVDSKILKSESKGTLATVDMPYNSGERLKFTGASGNYRTVITDIPSSSKTINFNFIACTDGDYNIYQVVVIGTQTWMAENLKTTKYNDGTAITNVTDNTAWSALSTAAYCDYANTPTYSNTYGRLYNWYAVASTNPKNVCPAGWHVASDAEWTTLATYLGGESVAGGKLKETGTTHWLSPNAGATNETGFTAISGGYRPTSGTFGLLGNSGFWWSSTPNASYAWYYYMYYGDSSINPGDNDRHAGFSVRCLKD